jgi:hypothetical protein
VSNVVLLESLLTAHTFPMSLLLAEHAREEQVPAGEFET